MKRPLLIAGAHLKGSGYPNAENTISILKESSDIHVYEYGTWLPDDYHLWKISSGPKLTAINMLIKIVSKNIHSFIRIIFLRTSKLNTHTIYIPYPSTFLLLLFRIIPKKYRPTLIADAYISIWDSMYRDRKYNQSSKNAIISKLIHFLEKVSLQTANTILVDTEANKVDLSSLFNLEESKISSLPLALDAQRFLNIAQYQPSKGQSIRVLFVGTLIPLHGISTILDAIKILKDHDLLEFHLVGEGQQSHLVENFISEIKPKNFYWKREWAHLNEIASEIEKADICLGIFGGNMKSSRVLPFKIYMYLAAGRAIISQEKLSTPLNTPTPPMKYTNYTPQELAQAILELANSPEERKQLSLAAKSYYNEYLNKHTILRFWENLLRIPSCIESPPPTT